MSEHEGNYYYLLMHPDLSSWNLPFISFDTRELFLEQFDNEHFGTFEWIIETGQGILDGWVVPYLRGR